MLKSYLKKISTVILLGVLFFISARQAFGASTAEASNPGLIEKGVTLWQIMVSGGVVMIFLGLLSVIATAFVIYHYKYVKIQKIAPEDFIDNLITLLDKKEYEKATSLCKQQENLVASIALKGLAKRSKGQSVVENAIQNEGKGQLEKLWQNLNYISDIAALAPMLGLLGTILGMIDAFHYFKAGSVHPGVLTQGLAKAMINTAFGLVIAVPCLAFYSYFRGKISRITSSIETAASEIAQSLAK